ncbi:hypothetical protein TNIN_79731 [Trichonephila inaurata madagascariensis]|uniref:Uncharacterized protein n=1 Tax=Trichonephila inaurata madagascariensis TaxID=2747483 RepID=A0A8X7BY76_9ARAC|nr:hypothetical protein TNIN_79731 [Trichonephila inaurata madagascariensis]
MSRFRMKGRKSNYSLVLSIQLHPFPSSAYLANHLCKITLPCVMYSALNSNYAHLLRTNTILRLRTWYLRSTALAQDTSVASFRKDALKR